MEYASVQMFLTKFVSVGVCLALLSGAFGYSVSLFRRV